MFGKRGAPIGNKNAQGSRGGRMANVSSKNKLPSKKSSKIFAAGAILGTIAGLDLME